MESTLREGVTTGVCAAAAAMASARYVFREEISSEAQVELIGKAAITLPVIHVEGATFGCVKDAGDDPDVTDGVAVCALVERFAAPKGTTLFVAGEGVGTVTRPGLKVEVGEPAINPVPRSIIEMMARRYAGDAAIRITISLPGGEQIAQNTYTPRLGITGGLSILGTTGIVKPMSEEAVKQSLLLDLKVKAQRSNLLAFAFSETGEMIAANALGLELEKFVIMGNYVGFMLKKARELNVMGVLLTGHMGKMAKVAGGSMQTHSAYSDGRMAVLAAHAAAMGAEPALLEGVLASNTTREAKELLALGGFKETFWKRVAEAAAAKAREYAGGGMAIEAALFDGEELLARSGNFETTV